MKNKAIVSHSYPVTPQDRMNYLLNLFSADQQIAIILAFPEKLNLRVLKQAIETTLSLVPILNCRFVEAEAPYWERIENSIDTIFSWTECMDHDIEEKVNEYIVEPGDRINGPMLQARLVRAQKDDVLCVKISHLCSDGTGLKEYIALLASAYNCLDKANDFDITESKILKDYKPGFRDQSQLFAAAGIKDIKSAYRQEAGSASLWGVPSNPNTNDNPRLSIRRIKRIQFDHLIGRVKEYGATVNDALITAYFRALQKHAVHIEPRTIEKAIGITVDLRRYLPNRTTGMVCNLSGMEMPVIELQCDELFEATLKKVKNVMDTIKRNQPGLSSAAGMELLAERPLSALKEFYRQQHDIAIKMKMALPLLTNFGNLAEGKIQFGDIEAYDGFMAAPIMYAPFFCTGVSTYNGVLTLAVGFHAPAVSEEAVDRLLDTMIRELDF